MAHLDAYIRVSKVAGRSGSSFISPELQRQQVEEYAQRHGHTLTVHEPELDVSGGKMRRVILDRVLQRIKDGQTEGIIVAKLSRFARTLIGGLTVLQDIQAAGGTLVTVAEDIDFSTRSGKLLGNILLSIAEDELERHREEWADAQRHAVERGIYTASKVPAGYDKDSSRGLVSNDDAPVVKLAYEMRGRGESLRVIAEMLSEQLPGHAWTNQAVERLFTTRVYRGELVRGDLRNAEAHEPIVNEREWQLANNGVKRRATRVKRENLLTGVIRCAACSHAMTPTYSTTNGGRNRIAVYKCRGARHSYGKCPEPSSITRAKADAYVEQAWREQMAGVVIVGTPGNDLDAVTRRVTDAEDELRAFASDHTARRTLGAQMYAEALEGRSAALQDAQRALTEAMSESAGAPSLDSYEGADVADKREMISATLGAVFVRRGAVRGDATDRMLIRWHGEIEDNLPGRGRRVGAMPVPVVW
jgi:site-specific DNA recombinase